MRVRNAGVDVDSFRVRPFAWDVLGVLVALRVELLLGDARAGLLLGEARLLVGIDELAKRNR